MSTADTRPPSVRLIPGVEIFNGPNLSEEMMEQLHEPFRAEAPGFLLMLSGTMTFQSNFQAISCNSGSIHIIRPTATYSVDSISDDARFCGIVFTTDFLLANSLHISGTELFQILSGKEYQFKLSGKVFENFQRQFAQLNALAEMDNGISFYSEIIHHQVMALIFMGGALFEESMENTGIKLDRRQELTARFLDLLRTQFKNERSLRFYADRLSVTTGHLTKVVKQLLGRQASELIDEAVIMEAKILLNNPSVTVAYVAEELKFSDQSFFGKYFKKHTGFSPSVYKQQFRKTKNNLF